MPLFPEYILKNLKSLASFFQNFVIILDFIKLMFQISHFLSYRIDLVDAQIDHTFFIAE